MKNKKRLIAIAILLSLVFVGWGCKSSNDAIEELKESDIVKAVAKFVGFNINQNSRVDGIIKVEIQGSQAFDSNYWGYDNSPNIFLEDNNETLSYYETFDDPDPGNDNMGTFNDAFADGTFPENRAMTGTVRPVEVTALREDSYTATGNKSGDWYETWTISYNSSTGYPSSMSQIWYDPNTDEKGDPGSGNVAEYAYTFATDSYEANNDYFQSSRSWKDYNGDLLGIEKTVKTGIVNFDKPDIDGSNTRTCYDADETTMTTSRCGGNWDASDEVDSYLADVGTYAKFYKTYVLSGSTLTETLKFYDASNVEMDGRVVVTTRYADLKNWRLAAKTAAQYDVASDGTTTETKKVEYTYTNGYYTTRKRYSNETLDTTATVTWDAQGRMKSFVSKNASDETVFSIDYTFDSVGRQTSQTWYLYTSGVKNSTPACAYGDQAAQSRSYSRDSSGNTTITWTYDCSSGSYDEDGLYQKEYIYSATGLVTSYVIYDLSSGSAVLYSKETYTYDTNGNRTKKQYYSVTSGTATENGYETYAYDSHKFKVTTKKYDADGDLSTDPTNTTSKCSALSSTSECYSTLTYTYK